MVMFAAFLFCFFFFFFNDTATTEIYTLSLHDALPISAWPCPWSLPVPSAWPCCCADRKSTRLNSSHVRISYAVFCLKKKKSYEKKNKITKKHKKNKKQKNTKKQK